MMIRLTAPVFLAAAIAAGTAALAQDDTISLGEDVNPGPQFTSEAFSDWEVRCTPVAEDRNSCQMYQLMQDDKGNAVAEVTMFPLADQDAVVAGATIATPLETLLSRQVTLRIDGGLAKRYPFTFCNVSGCFSRIGFTGDEVDLFKGGSAATVSIVPLAATDQVVTVTMSLKGFTAAYDRLAELAPAAE